MSTISNAIKIIETIANVFMIELQDVGMVFDLVWTGISRTLIIFIDWRIV